MRPTLRRVLSLLAVWTWALVLLVPTPVRAQGVSLSPSSSISTAGADCSTATTCAGIQTSGLASFCFYLNVGSSGTFNWEINHDASSNTGGTNAWVTIDDDAGNASATADGAFCFQNSGFTRFRIRASAISGAATVVAARGFGLSSSVAIGDVMIDTAALATSAKQDTLAGHVDGVETLLSTIDGRVDGIETLLSTIDGRVDGLETLLGTSNTNTAATAATLALLDDALGPLAGAATATKMLAGGGQYNTTLPTLTNGQQAVFQLTDNGRLMTREENSAGMIALLTSLDNNIDSIEGRLADESSHASAVIPTGPGVQGEAKDIDGSALNNLVTEGQSARIATTLFGGPIVVLANEAGTTDLGALIQASTTSLAAAVAGHDGTFAASVFQNGLAYRADLSGTAGVSNGEAVRGLGDDLGRGLGGLVCVGPNIIDGQADITDGSSTSVVAAAGANIVTEVWEVDINNSSATQVYVDFRDGTGGAVLRRFPVPAASGISRSLKVPIRTTANTALAADPSASATTVNVSVGGCSTR